MVQMMTKVHVNQQHKLHGVDDDKGTKSTTHIAWCR